MNLKQFAFLILVFSISVASRAQHVLLSHFEETDPPKPYSKNWYPLNSSEHSFELSIVDGVLNITKGQTERPTGYDVKDGKLFALDNGEFGGALYYKPNDTTVKQIVVNGMLKTTTVPKGRFMPGLLLEYNEQLHKHLKGAIYIAAGNFQKIFAFRDGIYLQSGLAHMGFSDGAFSKIEVNKNNIGINNVLVLDDCPFVFGTFKDAIYLTTFKTFRVITNWKEKVVLKDLFWEALYPNSIAVKNERTVYVGIRGGYVELDPETGLFKFYKYKF